ncbi:outer membrane beta-barrel protein [Novosphingobium sp.]|uniref:outer membrane beta-barrel protein n=1 Tax=Novosphingobium sp. TaxID=1874826 RepID=UPI0025EE903E|nr:outer membrane beta-barrel protein [Novosphingobium sp.]
MPRQNQISQKIANHTATESGRPITRPKAKLRRGQGAFALWESIRFIVAALLTIGNSLPLSDRKGHSLNKLAKGANARPADRLQNRSFHHANWLGTIFASLRLIVLAFSRDMDSRSQAAAIIRMGDARPGRTGKAAPGWVIRVALVALSLSGRAAFAQEADVATPVTLLDPVQADGIRIGGGLVLYPELLAEGRYDSNIYNIAAPKRSDAVFDLQPRFTLSTDFSRHQIELFGAANLRRYASNTGENSEAGELGLRGLLELASQIDVRPSVVLMRGIEQRGTAGDQFLTDRPVAFNRKEYGIEVSRGEHQLEIALGGKLSQTDYENASIGGVPVSLVQRNVIDRSAFARLAYNLGSRIQVYSRFRLSSLSYRDPAARQLNSSGYDALAGGRIRVTSLIDLEAGFGLIHRSFDNPAFRNLNAVNFALTASWLPRPTWQLIAGASRNVDPSPLINSPAIFRTSFTLEAKHLITPKLLVGVKAGHVREEYRGLGRVDSRYAVDATALYRLTRNIGVTFDAGYRKQDGGLLGRSFNGFAAGIGVKVVG